MSGKKVEVLNNSASYADPDEWLDVGIEPVSQPGSLSVSQSVSMLVETAGSVLDFLNSDPLCVD